MNKDEEKKPATHTPHTYHCNDCGGVIHRHDVFCSKCGKKLDHYDFEE